MVLELVRQSVQQCPHRDTALAHVRGESARMSAEPPTATIRVVRLAGHERSWLQTAEPALRRDHPAYAATAVIDELRRTEFARLDSTGHVYLDYTGGGLYGDSQLREHMRLLATGVFGNPHSISPTSAASTWLVKRARGFVHEYFRPRPMITWRSSRPTRRARYGSSARRIRPRRRPLPAHVRQSQLGQRHPRVRTRPGRRDDLRAHRRARTEASTRRCCPAI